MLKALKLEALIFGALLFGRLADLNVGISVGTLTLIRNSAKSGLGTRLLLSVRMFEPRHNIISNDRADIREYIVSCLKHSA